MDWNFSRQRLTSASAWVLKPDSGASKPRPSAITLNTSPISPGQHQAAGFAGQLRLALQILRRQLHLGGEQ